MKYKILEDKIKQENENFKELMKSNNLILLDSYKLLIRNDELFNRGKDYNLINNYKNLYNKLYGGNK